MQGDDDTTVTVSSGELLSVGDIIKTEDGVSKPMKIVEIHRDGTITVRNFRWYDFVLAYLQRVWRKVQEVIRGKVR